MKHLVDDMKYTYGTKVDSYNDDYGHLSEKHSMGGQSYKSVEKLYGFTVRIRDNGRRSYVNVLKEIQHGNELAS